MLFSATATCCGTFSKIPDCSSFFLVSTASFKAMLNGARELASAVTVSLSFLIIFILSAMEPRVPSAYSVTFLILDFAS